MPRLIRGSIVIICSILKWIFSKCLFNLFRLMIVLKPPDFLGRVNIFDINCPVVGSTGIIALFNRRVCISSSILTISFVSYLIGHSICVCVGGLKNFKRMPLTILSTNWLVVKLRQFFRKSLVCAVTFVPILFDFSWQNCCWLLAFLNGDEISKIDWFGLGSLNYRPKKKQIGYHSLVYMWIDLS